MTRRGQLLVFEGPDGVGKSTLAQEVSSALATRGIGCECLSFPGREVGSLGWHIYQLHHEPERFGVKGIPPTSLQLLHVAAHLDAIANRILPALRAGRCVVLDRFWWSTLVYGLVAGASKKTLEAMIEVERAVWEGFVPTMAFLVRRSRPFRDGEPMNRWCDLAAAYHDLSVAEQTHYPVRIIENEGPVAQALGQVIDVLDGLRFRVGTMPRPASRRRGLVTPRSTQKTGSEPDLFSFTPAQIDGDGSTAQEGAQKRKEPHAFCPMAPAKPSEVYETYWRFAAERQAIFFRRIEAVNPLTDDPILAQYKFTNAYRASDRASQYLIRNVIYQYDQSPEEVFFRTVLFKLFNKIETWELLQGRIGTPSFADYNFKRYANVFEKAMETGKRIYSAAYIMPSGSGDFEDPRKHRSHLKLLERMMADKVALRIAECRSMKQAFELIRSYSMIGDFLAYQYVTDINYSTLSNFSEMAFVVPGPGAKDGIRKCFHSLGGLNEADIIRWITEHQQEEFGRLGIAFRSLWGRDLQLIDCQNLFCEVDKYARLAHPHVKGISGRTRIKQAYRPNPVPITYWYPPKWGINKRVEETLRCREIGNAESHDAACPARPPASPS
jgi:thymidylate kinase